MLDPKEFVRSICHGRARIRHASLCGLSPEEVESLTTMIAGFDGITSVKLNPRVGSLLVTWDETKTNAESLLAAAQFFLPDEPAAEEAAESLKVRKTKMHSLKQQRPPAAQAPALPSTPPNSFETPAASSKAELIGRSTFSHRSSPLTLRRAVVPAALRRTV